MSVISGASRSTRDIQLYNITQSIDGWESKGDSITTFISKIDRSGGGIKMLHGTDNEGATITYGGLMFDLDTVGSRCTIETKFKYTVASADGGGFFFGLSNVVTSDVITDSDAMASLDAIGIFRATNSAFFRTTALNATAESGETSTTALASGTEYKLRLEIETLTGGITIRYYVDNVLIDTVTGFSTTNFTQPMALVAAIKVKGTVDNTLELYDTFVSARNMS